MAKEKVLSRYDATARMTEVMRLWLWGRGARGIAEEVGFGSYVAADAARRKVDSPVLTTLGARDRTVWRADLVGLGLGLLAKVPKDMMMVVEIKGTRADLAREDLQAGKWRCAVGGAEHYLAVPATLEDSYLQTVRRDLPSHWQIVPVDVDGLDVIGKVPKAPVVGADEDPQRTLRAVLSASTTAYWGGVVASSKERLPVKAARLLAAKGHEIGD